MKKLFSIALLFAFLYTIIGYYLVLSFLHIENKLQMNSLLEHNELLQVLRIQKSDIGNVVFHDEWKEISYEGTMYDVKKHSVEGDYIVLHCIADEIEEELLADLDENVQNNIDAKSSSGKKKSNPTKITLNDYCINMNKGLLSRPYDNAIFKSSDQHAVSFIGSIASPPPDLA